MPYCIKCGMPSETNMCEDCRAREGSADAVFTPADEPEPAAPATPLHSGPRSEPPAVMPEKDSSADLKLANEEKQKKTVWLISLIFACANAGLVFLTGIFGIICRGTVGVGVVGVGAMIAFTGVGFSLFLTRKYPFMNKLILYIISAAIILWLGLCIFITGIVSLF